MNETHKASVIIIGAGPVGLCLAIDLAWRGIDVTVVERRAAGELPSVKCNHVSSRTMEAFRRLGIAGDVRAAGLPDDYPNDVVFRTSATGFELARIPIPCRNDRYTQKDGPDGWWPTPEPPHRVNQIYLEPILFSHASKMSGITILSKASLQSFSQDEDGVSATILNLETNTTHQRSAQFLIGCDGGRSLVRRAIGSEFHGDAVIQRVQSSYIRSSNLLDFVTKPDAWMSYIYNPKRAGNLIAIDGKELWLVHNYLLNDELDFESVDRDACIKLLLGVESNFEYEILAKEDWIGRRLVADRFRDRRAFICGDASHLWVPYAGYGMNAGIADAMNLSWLLASHLNGWASEAVLDAYAIERQPITDQVSRFAMKHAEGAIAERSQVPPEAEEATEAGAAVRQKIGAAAYKLNVQQFACAGLNYGYYYENSPLIAYDDEPAPDYTMYDYVPSTVPGCRLPHFWLADGSSLYDAMGPEYVLIRFDPTIDVNGLLAAAAKYHMPLALLDIPMARPPAPYNHGLVLSRPDRHIAWRGNSLPHAPAHLIARLSGRP